MFTEIFKTVLIALRSAFRSRAALIAENAVLRQQIIVLRRSVPKPRIRARDRVVLALAARVFGSVLNAIIIVRPKTVVRWHRSFWRLLWRRKSRRPAGRPPADADLRTMIRRYWKENPRSGEDRIAGELRKLGYKVSPRTVAKYRPPHLPRNRGQRWSTFVRNHLHQTWACDRSELLRRTASPPNFATSFPAVSVSMARRFCHEITAMQLRFPAAAVADRPACFHAFAPLSFDKSCLMLCPPTMPTSPFSVPLPKSWPKHAKAATPHVISFAHFVIIHVRGFAVNSPIHRVRLAAERQGGRAHQHRGAAKL